MDVPYGRRLFNTYEMHIWLGLATLRIGQVSSSVFFLWFQMCQLHKLQRILLKSLMLQLPSSATIKTHTKTLISTHYFANRHTTKFVVQIRFWISRDSFNHKDQIDFLNFFFIKNIFLFSLIFSESSTIALQKKIHIYFLTWIYFLIENQRKITALIFWKSLLFQFNYIKKSSYIFAFIRIPLMEWLLTFGVEFYSESVCVFYI